MEVDEASKKTEIREVAPAEPKAAPAQVSKSEPPAKPEPATESPEQEKKRFSGSRRGGKKKSSFRSRNGSSTSNGAPSAGQRAFYSFLLHRHEETVTPEILEGPIEKMSEKIDALTDSLPASSGQATFQQWKKLYALVTEKATASEACKILNGITDITSTSGLIGEWLKKDPAPKTA